MIVFSAELGFDTSKSVNVPPARIQDISMFKGLIGYEALASERWMCLYSPECGA